MSARLDCLDDDHPEKTEFSVCHIKIPPPPKRKKYDFFEFQLSGRAPGLDLDAAAQCAVLLCDNTAFVDMVREYKQFIFPHIFLNK